MWASVVAALKLVTLYSSEKFERDKERRQKKKDIRKDLAAAIKARNPSAITSAYDRMRRL